MQSKCNLKGKSLKTLENKGFEALLQLFKLNRSRRLTCKIIEYAVYALNFINNTVHHPIKYCIRNLSRLRSHEVNGLNGAERHCIIVCSEVSHYTYASHICKGCKVLVRHPGRIFSVFFL